MVDERILHRVDLLLVMLAVWLLLGLVVASFALMVVNVAVGLLALVTVVSTALVTALSLRSSESTPEARVSLR
ncbi:MAG: hypothetical protein ACQETI_04890 [Halobacteriota archaeon]